MRAHREEIVSVLQCELSVMTCFVKGRIGSEEALIAANSSAAPSAKYSDACIERLG